MWDVSREVTLEGWPVWPRRQRCASVYTYTRSHPPVPPPWRLLPRRDMVARVQAEYGKLDILVNKCAGRRG